MRLDSNYFSCICVWRLYIRGTHCYSSFHLNARRELKRAFFSFNAPFFVFFTDQTQNMMNPANPSKQKIKTVKPKPYESNPCEKKKLNPSNRSNPAANATDQRDLPNKRKSNPSPISTSPSTTDFPYETHQTHRRSTHPPPLRDPIFAGVELGCLSRGFTF